MDTDKAGPTVERLLADARFTGRGIRALSDRERRDNPVGYHLGTVRPRDNARIAAGFWRGEHGVPVRRPVAGHPEARAAGAAATGEQGG